MKLCQLMYDYHFQLFILFILGPLSILPNNKLSRIKELQHKDRLFLCVTKRCIIHESLVNIGPVVT